MIPYTRLAFALYAACALVWALAGCGGGGSSSPGTGQLQVYLADAPLNADVIYVDIDSVQAHSTGQGWVTVKEFATPLHVNLLDYSSHGTSLLLADSPLAAGHYTMVRLMISAASVVVGGQPNAVDITDVAQTGIKCNGEFTVAAGQLMALSIDFNAAKSFVYSGGTYKLHPVMVMSPQNVASEVTGTVQFQDSSGAAAPVPEGAVVNVYTAGHVGDPAFLISGAIIGTDGTFRIGILPQGTYDFEVVATGFPTKQITGTAVAPPATDLGTIIVQAAPAG